MFNSDVRIPRKITHLYYKSFLTLDHTLLDFDRAEDLALTYLLEVGWGGFTRS